MFPAMKPSSILTLTLAVALSASGCATRPVALQLPAIANVVSPQPGMVTGGRLGADDIARVHDAGIRHVIDLTPDAETPDFDEAAAVRAAGLVYSNLPLDGAAGLTRANVHAFDAVLRHGKRPVLVHCSSGNRVGAIAALRAAWVQGHSAEDAIAIGKKWGLKGLEGEVRRRIGAGPQASP